MEYTVQCRHAAAQPIYVVHGRAMAGSLPAGIRSLFDQFYSKFKSHGELNIVYYSGAGSPGEFEIACGVQVQNGGNASTPAGMVATTVYIGPYDRMKPAHEAIHKWARENGKKLAGPSWEVYGHWNDDPSKLRTDIFYLVAD